jgi:hypothetical protein
METITNSEAFFFISSIGFIVLWALSAVFLFYLIRATKAFSRMSEKIEEDIDKIGDTTKEMIEDIHDSPIFRFLFKKKKRRRLK